MKAILVTEPGGPEKLTIGEVDRPQPAAKEVLVKLKYTAVNRADTLQRMGKYPPPPGASEIIGLELAGEIVETGANVSRWSKGDKVFGLLPGGGYAQYSTIHQDMAMPIPDNLTMAEAAAVPEVFLTAYQALQWLGKLSKGEKVLIHAGASGVGTAAIQLAKQMGAEVIVTASAGKHEVCKKLGADLAIDYKNEDFVAIVKEQGGVDLIIDFIGAGYFNQNINCLKMDGRMVMLALIGGAKVEEVDLRKVLGKRLNIMGSTLRARSLDYQIALTQDFAAFALPLLSNGSLKPVIDSEYSWQEVADAHRYMEANKNAGKIILKIAD
ncbi:MAG: NAD(P)H-quinone oxidoreductase [Cyclobacteriaceae bacterium]